MSRQYPIKYENAVTTLEKVLDNKEYRKELFPYFHLDANSVISIALSDIYGIPDEMKLDKEQRLALLEAYEKDLLNVSTDTLINSIPVGELTLQIPDPQQTGQTADATVPSYNTGHSYISSGFRSVYLNYICIRNIQILLHCWRITDIRCAAILTLKMCPASQSTSTMIRRERQVQ